MRVGDLRKMCSFQPICGGNVVKAVAHTRNSQDKVWPFRYRLDFLAELGYVDVQAVSACVGFGSPDFFEEHLAGEEFATMADEDFEQVVLGRCEGDILPVE